MFVTKHTERTSYVHQQSIQVSISYPECYLLLHQCTAQVIYQSGNLFQTKLMVIIIINNNIKMNCWIPTVTDVVLTVMVSQYKSSPHLSKKLPEGSAALHMCPSHQHGPAIKPAQQFPCTPQRCRVSSAAEALPAPKHASCSPGVHKMKSLPLLWIPVHVHFAQCSEAQTTFTRCFCKQEDT